MSSVCFPLLTLVAAMASNFESVCYDVFRGNPPHPSAPNLLQCVSGAAAADGAVPLPESEWVAASLAALGFVQADGGTMRAEPELVQRLVREQNAARARVHADAAAAREAILDRSLASSADDTVEPDLGAARAAVRKFVRTFDGPASGPLLCGAAALLRAQSGAERLQVWTCDRAALLNGGDAFCEHGVALLRALRVRPSAALATVEEGRATDQVSWNLQPAAWTSGELRALAALLERSARRLDFGGRATGAVAEAPAPERFEGRIIASWPLWLHSLVGSLLCRLL